MLPTTEEPQPPQQRMRPVGVRDPGHPGRAADGRSAPSGAARHSARLHTATAAPRPGSPPSVATPPETSRLRSHPLRVRQLDKRRRRKSPHQEVSYTAANWGSRPVMVEFILLYQRSRRKSFHPWPRAHPTRRTDRPTPAGRVGTSTGAQLPQMRRDNLGPVSRTDSMGAGWAYALEERQLGVAVSVLFSDAPVSIAARSRAVVSSRLPQRQRRGSVAGAPLSARSETGGVVVEMLVAS